MAKFLATLILIVILSIVVLGIALVLYNFVGLFEIEFLDNFLGELSERIRELI